MTTAAMQQVDKHLQTMGVVLIVNRAVTRQLTAALDQLSPPDDTTRSRIFSAMAMSLAGSGSR
jgi:hypothetical protein